MTFAFFRKAPLYSKAEMLAAVLTSLLGASHETHHSALKPVPTTFMAGTAPCHPAGSCAESVFITYINLDDRTDRRSMLEKDLTRLQAHSNGVISGHSRFPAVRIKCYDDAYRSCDVLSKNAALNTTLLEDWMQKRGHAANWLREMPPTKRAGTMGAFNSHTTALQTFRNGDPAVGGRAPLLLLLEDDIQVKPDLFRCLDQVLAAAHKAAGGRPWHILRFDPWGEADPRDLLGEHTVMGHSLKFYVARQNYTSENYLGAGASIVPRERAAELVDKLWSCAPAGLDSCGYQRLDQDEFFEGASAPILPIVVYASPWFFAERDTVSSINVQPSSAHARRAGVSD